MRLDPTAYGMDELIYYLLSIFIAPLSLDNINKKFLKMLICSFNHSKKKKNYPKIILH